MVDQTEGNTKMRRKPKKLKKPYPPTAEVMDAGLTLFGAGWGESYRLARSGVIVTIKTGARRMKALMIPTCAKLGDDPHQ
jgi:hypothetical protein